MSDISSVVARAIEQDQHVAEFGIFTVCLWHELRLPLPTAVQLDISNYLHRGPRRRMVKAFRGVGKSWLTAAYVLWRLLRDRNLRVLVVSASNDRAMGFTRFVRRLIDEVPWLRCLTPQPGQADSVLAFEVAGAEPHQSPSVKSASITGQITGSRAHIIVADDIEIPRNAQTVKLREQLAEQVKEFDAILLPGGEIIYLGTDQTETSLYKQLPSRGYDVRVWPARIPRKDKLAQYRGQLGPYIDQLIENGAEPWSPTDPERFTHHDLLEREASYGRSGFGMQFMLDPSLGDADRYPLKCADFVVAETRSDYVPTRVVWGSDPKQQAIVDLDCLGLTGDRWNRPMHVGNDWSPPDEVVMFIDPSGRGQDETAAAVIANFGPTLFVLAVDGWMDGYAEPTLKSIVELARRTQTQRVIVEPNFGGGMYTTILQQAFVRYGYPCTVQDSEYARTQKEARIIDTLEPLLVQHRLVISPTVVRADLDVVKRRSAEYGDEHGMAYSLVYQMTRLTRDRGALRHDDRVEALAGAAGYFVKSQQQSAEEADRARKARLLEEELQEFVQGAVGRAEVGPVWNFVR